MVITIDGAAGVGKTSTAKEVAKKLGFQYFDTGSMYRAVTLYFLEKNVDLLRQISKRRLIVHKSKQFLQD